MMNLSSVSSHEFADALEKVYGAKLVQETERYKKYENPFSIEPSFIFVSPKWVRYGAAVTSAAYMSDRTKLVIMKGEMKPAPRTEK